LVYVKWIFFQMHGRNALNWRVVLSVITMVQAYSECGFKCPNKEMKFNDIWPWVSVSETHSTITGWAYYRFIFSFWKMATLCVICIYVHTHTHTHTVMNLVIMISLIIWKWNQTYIVNSHTHHTSLCLKLICISGQVTIEFQVEKETNFIVFHSKNLTITEKVSTVFMYCYILYIK
jgi:hypothetical protein